MATPLNPNFARVSTRRTSSGLVSPSPDPERVFRERLNRLSRSRALASLGQEAISDIHLLFQEQVEPSIMGDLFAPCNFTNINGYPHNIPDKAIEKLPSFQGNNAISATSHVKNFNVCIRKWCNTANYEDVKMRLFVLSLEEDALDWFTEQPANSYDSLQAILTAFLNKFGEKKENRHLINAISNMKKNENETMEEFNKRFNELVKSMPATVKPPDEFLLCSYLDAFGVDTAYELRRKEPANLSVAQSEALKIERARRQSGKSEIPGFNRGPSKSNDYKGKEKEETTHDPIKELTQLIKSMEANHTNQMNAIQNRLVAMERNQAQRFQTRPNDRWQNNKGPQQEHRPPNPLESTNMVDQIPPFCRPCNEFHEEATCPYVKRIMESGMQGGTSGQINMFSMEDQIHTFERNQGIDHRPNNLGVYNMIANFDEVTKIFGEKPTSGQILAMAKHKGMIYQRRDIQDWNNHRNFSPPTSELNFDLGNWVNNAKVSIPVTELLKIPSQRAKLLSAIEVTQREEKHSDEPEDEEIVLKSMNCYVGNEDHQPFYVSLIVNDRLLHNCMLDSGASSNVMTKKVMEQLNLRVSRPYHNICSMDSKRIEVCGIIKDLQVFLAAYTDRIMTMDIVVIDVPDAWGMLLSRKWASDLGGSLQMDLSYATIPMPDNTFVRLDRELEKRYHVEDPRRPNNEIIYRSCQTGSDAVLTNFFPPLTEHIQNEEIRHSSKRLSTSNFPSKHFQDKAVGLVINASSSPSQLTKKKRKKRKKNKNIKNEPPFLSRIKPQRINSRKRKRKRFGISDGHKHVEIGAIHNPKIVRIGQGTSKKEPMDLLVSRQVLMMDFTKDI